MADDGWLYALGLASVASGAPLDRWNGRIARLNTFQGCGSTAVS